MSEAFGDANLSIVYNPQLPAVLSASTSYWARGKESSFDIIATDTTTISVSNLPLGLDFNSTNRKISGVPEVGGVSTITITASNPAFSTSQIHRLEIIDLSVFSTKLELTINESSLGGKPSDVAGLALHLDASSLPDQNDSVLENWPDLSGNERGLIKSGDFLMYE